MPRYITRPKAWCEDDFDEYPNPPYTSLEVCDHQAVDTGLLDKDGNSIWRAPDPIGFVHFDA